MYQADFIGVIRATCCSKAVKPQIRSHEDIVDDILPSLYLSDGAPTPGSDKRAINSHHVLSETSPKEGSIISYIRNLVTLAP